MRKRRIFIRFRQTMSPTGDKPIVEHWQEPAPATAKPCLTLVAPLLTLRRFAEKASVEHPHRLVQGAGRGQ